LAVSLTENAEFQRALAAFQAGNVKDAERLFKAVLRRQPKHVAALNLLGIVLTQLGRFAEAENYLRLALEEQANSDATLYNYGVVLKALNRPAEALERFSQALKINASVAETWNNRGTVFNDLKRHGEAVADFDRAMAAKANYPDAFCNKGKALAELKLYKHSLGAYDHALVLKPDLAEAWLGRGNVFIELRQYDYALAAYDRALELKPDLAEAWLGRGTTFYELKRYDDAIAAYGRALALKPNLDYAASLRLRAKLTICDWTDLEAEIAQLLATMKERRLSSDAFAILTIPSSSADQLQCARRCIQDQPTYPPIWRGEVYTHDRIRVAYLSADFHEHPTAYLLAGLFEQHDKSRFEITGISFGPNRDSPMRHRLRGAFEHFVDVWDKSEEDIADLVRRLEIDIAVDLMGHTKDSRLGVFARRPAPIQVSYLGYLGTMGAEFIDYVIADQIALPSDQQKNYTENIVHLPDCFLVNDSRLAIAPYTPSRGDVGLPAEGFLFCSFNNSYKLGRPMFELWMRLLHAVEGSVLWLVETNAEMAVNLRREAQRCGIDPGRIIFAPRIALSEHLARQRLAGLFLDTTPYNAGATGAAALWSGVPLLTMIGKTFVGRMAASMLHAVGLPELVTESLPDYEALALKIATEPALCASLKDKLARNRETYPLFNTERFTRHIEAAYTKMWKRYQGGEKPENFAVDPRPDLWDDMVR